MKNTICKQCGQAFGNSVCMKCDAGKLKELMRYEQGLIYIFFP
jgi:hypothetical protein